MQVQEEVESKLDPIFFDQPLQGIQPPLNFTLHIDLIHNSNSFSTRLTPKTNKLKHCISNFIRFR